MAREGYQTLFTHHVTQELQGGSGERALTWIYCEPVGMQYLEKLRQVFQMLLQGRARNQMVIQVSKHEREMAEQPIHQPLECLSSIC
jgi:hypothetical protein